MNGNQEGMASQKITSEIAIGHAGMALGTSSATAAKEARIIAATRMIAATAIIEATTAITGEIGAGPKARLRPTKSNHANQSNS